MTNHIDHRWWDDPQVISLLTDVESRSGLGRSPSVGDVVPDVDGIRHVVVACGYAEF